MMGLQVAANKRKYEIGACTDLNDIQPNCTPEKNPRLDNSHTRTITTTTTSTSSSTSELTSTSLNATSRENESTTTTPSTQTPVNGERIITSTKSQEITPLTGRGHEITLAKLNTVSIGSNPRAWSNGTEDDETVIDPISKLQAVAVPDEAWGSADSTRSTLATTLLPPDDLDEDIDDFEDDFDDDDCISPDYARVPYRMGVPSQEKEEPVAWSPFYPNSPSGPPIYQGHRYGPWSNQLYDNEPMPISDPPQTIRCAENGKSYTELGTYTFLNSNAGRFLRRLCNCKQNTWCNSKQCYKDKRLRMMNMSMFKLSRFRQASDQSLYRSVLICNTLKAIEKEIETEKRQMKQNLVQANARITEITQKNQQMRQQQQQQQQQQNTSNNYASGPHSIISNSNNSNSSVSNRVNRVTDPVSDITNHNNEQKRIEYNENNPNSSNTSSNNLLTNGNNYLQSYTNHNRTYGGGSLTGFESIPPPPQPYEYHPLKDPQSGRATPFPATNSYPDTDSGYGEEGDLTSDGQFRPINWGSVLSLSSQSALDPFNNNELFSSTSTYITSNSCGSSSFYSNFSSPTTTNLIDMDLGYKFTSFGSDDFLKVNEMTPSKVVYENDMPDAFSTHIMVGS